MPFFGGFVMGPTFHPPTAAFGMAVFQKVGKLGLLLVVDPVASWSFLAVRPAFGVLARVFGRGFPQVLGHGFCCVSGGLVDGFANVLRVRLDGQYDFTSQVINFDDRHERSPPLAATPGTPT